MRYSGIHNCSPYRIISFHFQKRNFKHFQILRGSVIFVILITVVFECETARWSTFQWSIQALSDGCAHSEAHIYRVRPLYILCILNCGLLFLVEAHISITLSPVQNVNVHVLFQLNHQQFQSYSKKCSYWREFTTQLWATFCKWIDDFSVPFP